jgi:hypothetical protein
MPAAQALIPSILDSPAAPYQDHFGRHVKQYARWHDEGSYVTHEPQQLHHRPGHVAETTTPSSSCDESCLEDNTSLRVRVNVFEYSGYQRNRFVKKLGVAIAGKWMSFETIHRRFCDAARAARQAQFGEGLVVKRCSRKTLVNSPTLPVLSAVHCLPLSAACLTGSLAFLTSQSPATRARETPWQTCRRGRTRTATYGR